jgi:signal transduction histidine kinase
MTIRRILQLAALISIVSSVLMTATFFASRQINHNNIAVTLQLNVAARKISLMGSFVPDLDGLAHQRAQHAELTPLLAVIPVLDARATSLKLRIVEEHESVGALLESLSRENASALSIANREILVGQLDVRIASIMVDIQAMDAITVEHYVEQEKWLRITRIVSLMALAGVIMGLLALLYWRVVIPIIKIEHASARISAGQLDEVVSISGNDEIAALAASFESMRIALRKHMRALDAAHQQINQENEMLVQRVDERTAELRAANQELDSFAYAVSHDLRAPLRAMSGFSQALIEDYGPQMPSEASDYLQQINLASLRMGELINGLLLLSRSTRTELRHDVIDLSAMSQYILADLAHADPARQVACEVAPGLTARGDPRMMEAALRNLLDNAWKFAMRTPQATIRVCAEQRDGETFFCVSDNGAGFDMAHAGKLFQPFQRLHRQEEFPGTGIGLATVQRIVHRHGGVITAESTPGKGARFCFSLPAV